MSCVGIRNAIVAPNGVPNAQPEGLIIRTNAQLSQPFFEQLLPQAGFSLGIDGVVEVVP